MTYGLIDPPSRREFRDMTKEELRSYFSWFIAAIPSREQELAKAVVATAGFADWQPDHEPSSLDRLGDWFEGQVDTRPRTSTEVAVLKASLPFAIEVPDRDLTEKTFSIAIDVGIYFGQVLKTNIAGVKWTQILDNKRYADYGCPLLKGSGPVPVNPVRISITLAYAIAAGEQTGKKLREVYELRSTRI